MALQAMMGQKLRRLRQREGLTQVAMAGRLGISASYLNLIEHNQRGLNRPLLLKLAENFELDLKSFSGSEETRLLADLTELFGDPLFKNLTRRDGELNELVGAAPGVCQAILTLYRSYRSLGEDIRGLSERLAQDPYFADSSHQLLTLLTSIRSFAEILHHNVDLAANRRQKFVAILVEESEKLTEQVKQLFAFIAGEGLLSRQQPESPADEVAAALQTAGNHFPALEVAAEALHQDCGLAGPERRAALRQALARRRRNGSNGASAPTGDSAAPLAGAPPESQDFALARQLAAAACAETLDSAVAAAALSPAAVPLYRRALASYLAAALLMPYEDFKAAARSLRHDLDLLCSRFGVSYEQACHRLTTLSRPGAEGVPLHFIKLDIAGNVVKRFGGSGLRIPRFGGVCPRWNAHSAFMAPGRFNLQLAELPDGLRYFNVARTVEKPGAGFRAPKGHYSITIGCEIAFAGQFVYADGLDLTAAEGAMPVGTHCRLCERSDCQQRAFAALAAQNGQDRQGGAG